MQNRDTSGVDPRYVALLGTLLSSMDEPCDVLVVDDDETILELLEDFLSPQYHIYKASNAMEALTLLDTQRAHVLVTDLYLPMMDGMEFIERVRANSIFDRMAIVVLTAYPPLLNRIKTPLHGVVYKPFILADLARAVQQAIASIGPPCA